MAGKNHVDCTPEARVVWGGQGGGSHVTYVFAESVEWIEWISKKVTQKSRAIE
jgi:hypothetical protein